MDRSDSQCWDGTVMRNVGMMIVGRKVLEFQLPLKRKSGRPKRRYFDVVKEDTIKPVRACDEKT